MLIVKEKIILTFVKNGEADFIKGNYYNGFLW